MKANCFLLVILSCLLLISCKVSNDDIAGTYCFSEKNACSFRFNIKEDNSFDYVSHCGYYEMSFGLWKLSSNGRKIILNSYIDNIDSISINVKEYNNSKKSSLIIFNKPMFDLDIDYKKLNKYPELYNSEYDSLYYNIVINDTITYKIYSDSITIGAEIKIFNFYFKMNSFFEGYFNLPHRDTIFTKKYLLKDSINNVFNVSFPFPKMKWGDIFYQVPINDTLIIKNNSLKWKKEKVRLKKIKNGNGSNVSNHR